MIRAFMLAAVLGFAANCFATDTHGTTGQAPANNDQATTATTAAPTDAAAPTASKDMKKKKKKKGEKAH